MNDVKIAVLLIIGCKKCNQGAKKRFTIYVNYATIYSTGRQFAITMLDSIIYPYVQ
jgi:hypothetical protein